MDLSGLYPAILHNLILTKKKKTKQKKVTSLPSVLRYYFTVILTSCNPNIIQYKLVLPLVYTSVYLSVWLKTNEMITSFDVKKILLNIHMITTQQMPFLLWIDSKTLYWKGLEYTDCISCRVVRPYPPKKEYPRYATKLHLVVRLLFWSSEEYWSHPFFAITPRFTWYLLVFHQIDLLKTGTFST